MRSPARVASIALFTLLPAAALLHNAPQLVVASGSTDTAAQLPRGIPPKLADQYSPDASGLFPCRDGSKRIPFDRVNDDYCDCDDGSDEPGTSACANGSFYCQNSGWRAVSIPAWKVNDGVCDTECCDGSDEWSGRVVCPSRCKEFGDEERARKRAKQQEKVRAFEKRKEYARTGRSMVGEKKLALVGLEKAEIAAKEEVVRITGVVNRLEEMEEKALEGDADAGGKIQNPLYAAFLDCVGVHKEVRLHTSNLEDDSDRIEIALIEMEGSSVVKKGDDGIIKDVFAKFADWRKLSDSQREIGLTADAADVDGLFDDYIDNHSHQREFLADADADDIPTTNPLASQIAHCSRSLQRFRQRVHQAEENSAAILALGQTIAENYYELSDSAISAVVQVYKDIIAERQDRNADNSDPVVASNFIEEDWIDGDGNYAPKQEPQLIRRRPITSPEEVDVEAPGLLESVLEWFGYDDGRQVTGTTAVHREARRAGYKDIEAARDALSNVRNTHYDAKEALRKAKKFISADFGLDSEFAPLFNKCITGKEGQFTYEVCLFGDVTQRWDGNSANLGSFKEWNIAFPETDPMHYSMMRFSDGDYCFEGPNRSLNATLVCGPEEKVLSASEPSKCEYIATIATPALCVEDPSAQIASDEYEHDEL